LKAEDKERAHEKEEIGSTVPPEWVLKKKQATPVDMEISLDTKMASQLGDSNQERPPPYFKERP
jgi:hypothetical protein